MCLAKVSGSQGVTLQKPILEQACGFVVVLLDIVMNVLVAIVWPNGLSMLHGGYVGSRGILLVWLVWKCDNDVVGLKVMSKTFKMFKS